MAVTVNNGQLERRAGRYVKLEECLEGCALKIVKEFAPPFGPLPFVNPLWCTSAPLCPGGLKSKLRISTDRAGWNGVCGFFLPQSSPEANLAAYN